jgi:oligopeptide/dipeptide ABC transporter ATP-binding protein
MQAIAGLSPAAVSGQILLNGKREVGLGQTLGMIFQDPMSALNPTMKIGRQMIEGLLFHEKAKGKEAKERALALLDLVGIPDPIARFEQYPHQLSGGQRQRVLIAMALLTEPKLLIADEPTTALDSATREQILELIQAMQRRFNMGLILISHDLTAVSRICDEIHVMYAGRIVEKGTTNEVLEHPRHPYTQMLLGCIPKKGHPLQAIEGGPPSLFLQPRGCAFKERCPYAALKCMEEPRGSVACWRVHD